MRSVGWGWQPRRRSASAFVATISLPPLQLGLEFGSATCGPPGQRAPSKARGGGNRK